MRGVKQRWISDDLDKEISRIQSYYRSQYKDISKIDITKKIAENIRKKKLIIE